MRHKSEDLRELDMLLRTRVMGKEKQVRRKTAVVVFYTTTLFYLEVIQVQEGTNMLLTRAEKQLIEIIRSLNYGEVRVMIKECQPIRMEEIRRSIQLPIDK